MSEFEPITLVDGSVTNSSNKTIITILLLAGVIIAGYFIYKNFKNKKLDGAD